MRGKQFSQIQSNFPSFSPTELGENVGPGHMGRGSSRKWEAWVEAPFCFWPQTKSLNFWTLVYFSMNENISTVVGIACPFITGLEDGNKGGCEHKMNS